MAYMQDGMALINNGGKSKLYLYTSTNARSTILVNKYFPSGDNNPGVGDVIIVNASNAVFTVRVTAITADKKLTISSAIS